MKRHNQKCKTIIVLGERVKGAKVSNLLKTLEKLID